MSRHGLLVFRGATALLLTLLCLASGYKGYLVADSILESVEVLNFKHAIISVDYDMSPSPGYVDELDELALQTRFDLFDHTYSTITKQEELVRFTMGEVPRISFNTFTIEGESLEVEFTLHYRPKQFDLIPGVFTYGRKLRITYPSLYTLRVANVTDLTLESNFTLAGRLVDMEAFALKSSDQGDHIVGDTIGIEKIGEVSGSLKFCIAALTERGDDRPVAKAFGSSCEKLVIPTDGSMDAVLYDLHIIGVRGDAMGYIKQEFRLAEPPLAIRLVPERTSVRLGTGLALDVHPAQPLEGCTVNVYDSFWTKKNTLDLQTCTNVVVGTSTSWAPGTYLVEVEGYHQGLVGRATARFELIGVGGIMPADTKTDKDVYKAGEDVSLYTDAPGDICSVQVFNQDGIKVMEEESLGCGNAELSLDPSLDPGAYTIQTTAYRDNQNVGGSVNMIEVSEWRPQLRTPQSEVCEGGSMHVLGATLPCIQTGQTCTPSSSDIPLCLCFDKETGDVLDVCEYGRYCSPTDCTEQRIKSPFIIIETDGECMAKSGLQTLSCIDIGEVCMGTCVCLGKDKNPEATCVIGEMCATEGCAPSNLEFSLIDLEPRHIRSDVLLTDGVNVIWRGNIRYEGALLEEGALADLNVNASLHVLDASSAPTIKRVHDDQAGGWTIEASFIADLPPGEYEVFIVIEYKGNIHVIRRPFEVWYPEDESFLRVSQHDIEPDKVRPKDFEIGFPLQTDVVVQDLNGRSVVNLPKKAFNITFGELAPASFTPTYNKLSDRWQLSTTFMDTLLFTWDDVPGPDNGKVRSYLRRTFGEDWMEHADISKSSDERTITMASGNDWLEFALDGNNIKATVRTDDGEGHELAVREEMDRLIVYTALPTEQAISVAIEHLGRSGNSKEPIEVTDYVPLDFRIQRASPGNDNEPLIHYLAVMGFNLDIFLQIKGTIDVSERNFHVFIGERNVTENLAYLVSTTSGVRLHLSDISLCPHPPNGGSTVELLVEIHTPQGVIESKRTDLQVKSNPGRYVVGCT